MHDGRMKYYKKWYKWLCKRGNLKVFIHYLLYLCNLFTEF